jgi:hypothetical protein
MADRQKGGLGMSIYQIRCPGKIVWRQKLHTFVEETHAASWIYESGVLYAVVLDRAPQHAAGRVNAQFDLPHSRGQRYMRVSVHGEIFRYVNNRPAIHVQRKTVESRRRADVSIQT